MRIISVSALFMLAQSVLISPVQAELLSLWGRIGMSGSIVDSACAIDTGSYEQTVDMGMLPIGTLRQQGRGPVRPFSIALIGCTLTPYAGEAWQKFSVTFDGPVDGEWFLVSGDARGVALALQDAQGQPIYPGQSPPKQAIVSGNSMLHYGLQLVSDTRPLRPGEYQGALRFKLDYY
ncbi:fimbrial protein [Providencia sp. PROV197]|uniref:fimbrial protein n=1 Tax=Providencia sp. PROV197 TaxID=2949898 RepID=UPI00234A537E|nr:fimbrial protein [Providencia sp. PROV197]